MEKEKQEKKNILIFITHIKIGGGAEKIGVSIANGLEEQGHNVSLLVLQDFPDKYKFNGDDYIVFDKNFKKSNPFSQLIYLFVWGYKLAKLCKNKNIDTVISVAKGPGLTSVISKLFGNKSKIITSVHTQPKQQLHGVIMMLVRYLYRMADVVVGVSNGIESELNKYLSLKNTVTINNFVNKKEIDKQTEKPLPDEAQIIYDSGPVALNIGRLIHAKGQWYLIRAFSKVVKEIPKAKLIILGEEELRQKLEILIKQSGLENSVFLSGVQDNVFPFLKAADYFVLSSLNEGFGIVLLEAIASGIPIISTDCKSGPRGILAPELKVSQNINYPYNGRYGTLIEPLKDKEVWEPAGKVPLTKPEQMLADEMIKKFKSKKQTKRNYISKRFWQKSVISEWEEII